MARRNLFSTISSAAAILILAAGCGDAVPTAIALDEPALTAEDVATLGKLTPPNIVHAAAGRVGGTFQKVIGTEGGTLEFAGGSITFPAGALAEDTRIQAHVNSRLLAVAFAPHGIQFPADAPPTLSMSYAGTGAGDNLEVLYLGDNGAVEENLGGEVSNETKEIAAKLNHFSAYVLASN